MPIYKICNVGANRYLNIHGSDLLGTYLTSNLYKVTIWSRAESPEQMWFLPSLSTNTTTYIRSYMNNDVGLNIVTSNSNCTIHQIEGNKNDAEVELVQTSTVNCYKIRLKNHPSKYLTAANSSEGALAIWSAASSSNLQVWKFEQQTLVYFQNSSTVYANNGTRHDRDADYENYHVDKMNANAVYIYNYLKGKKFTRAAICAMLGNMQIESSINPGIWRTQNNTSGAYGIAQCYPAQDFIEWCARINILTESTANATGINNLVRYPQTLMDAELMFILWECEIKGGVFKVGIPGVILQIETFDQFKNYNATSATDYTTVRALAKVFGSYFERPSNSPDYNYSERELAAVEWFKSTTLLK